jgi:hypothetical protein
MLLAVLSETIILFGIKVGGLKASNLVAESVLIYPIKCSCVIWGCWHTTCCLILIAIRIRCI